MKVSNFFNYLDKNAHHGPVRVFNQLFPVLTCLILFAFFMLSSHFFIKRLIDPFSSEPVRIELHLLDVAVGFFLYFVTAIDYALIVGRMTITNRGAKARFIMNVCTCLGCFFGVTIVLFLWGYAKEVPLLIVGLLTFAGSVMIKLAYEGREYFEHSKEIPTIVRTATITILSALHYVTSVFTFWIPDLGSPKVEKMSAWHLAKWSLILPFIIGLDDLIGYLGAMTIYNAFSLLFGIYLADIVIDILIFISPSLTRKIVENAVLSILAAYAFLYLAYKSYSETFHTLHQSFHLSAIELALFSGAIICVGVAFSYFNRKKLLKEPEHVRGEW